MRCQVADPEGYREIERTVTQKVVFIICNEKNQECFRDSNGKHNPDLKTMEEMLMEAWNTMPVQFHVTKDINDWLYTFLDHDWMQILTEENMTCIYDNWLFSNDMKKERVIREFCFTGIPMCIYEVIYEHRF